MSGVRALIDGVGCSQTPGTVPRSNAKLPRASPLASEEKGELADVVEGDDPDTDGDDETDNATDPPAVDRKPAPRFGGASRRGVNLGGGGELPAIGEGRGMDATPASHDIWIAGGEVEVWCAGRGVRECGLSPHVCRLLPPAQAWPASWPHRLWIDPQAVIVGCQCVGGCCCYSVFALRSNSHAGSSWTLEAAPNLASIPCVVAIACRTVASRSTSVPVAM